MKKLHFLLMAAALFAGMTACNKEAGSPEEEPAVYASITSSLGRDGDGVDGAEDAQTKSVVSVDVEKFHKAWLFAFNPSTGKILTYGSNAPSALQGQPVMISTTSTEFEWHLPLKTAMTIYTIVNYGGLDLSPYTSKGVSLTMADLDAITFSCASSTALQSLETSGYGLPMSGTTSVTASQLTTGTETLTIRVKKLFARYNIYLDLSDLAATHASVVAEHAMIYNMNTSVHYFGSGDKSTTSRIGSAYDRATDGQLEILQKGGNSNQVTFYVLENLQGDIAGASSWKTVYGDLGSDKLKYCTFLSLSVLLYDSDGRNETRTYKIYLGKTDMKSNFDVLRNYDKTIRLKVTDTPAIVTPPNDNPNEAYFYFTNSSYSRDNSVLSLAPGESATLYFKTSILASNLTFSATNSANGSSLSYITFGSPTVSTSGQGSVKITASSSAIVGTNIIVSGGSDKANDKTYLEIVKALEQNTITFYNGYINSNGAICLVVNVEKPTYSPKTLRLFFGYTSIDVSIPALPDANNRTYTPLKVFASNGSSDFTKICSYNGGTPAAGASKNATVQSLYFVVDGKSTTEDSEYKYTFVRNSTSNNFQIYGDKLATQNSYRYIDVKVYTGSSTLGKLVGFCYEITTQKRDTSIEDYSSKGFDMPGTDYVTETNYPGPLEYIRFKKNDGTIVKIDHPCPVFSYRDGFVIANTNKSITEYSGRALFRTDYKWNGSTWISDSNGLVFSDVASIVDFKLVNESTVWTSGTFRF